ETSRHKLLQLVLFGQPELDQVLALASMRQLKDRITHSFRMRPLQTAEVATYLSFRMRAAGYRGPDVFAPAAVRLIARAAGGVSRRINILADKALLAAYGEGTHAVAGKQARAAIADSELAPRRRAPRALAAFGATAAAGIVLGAGAYWLMAPPPPAPAAVISAAPIAVAVAPAPAAAPPSAPAAQPQLKREQLARMAGYDPGRNPLLHDRLEATRNKLDVAPDGHHSIELYLTDNSGPDRIERFLMRARDLVPLENVYIVPVESAGRYRIWALYGDFADPEQARQAAKRLPPKYQQAFPLAPRSFAELRRAL
ncbi:MAG: hypothetical protein ABI423_08530, partial [Burkholderiales bacterium]